MNLKQKTLVVIAALIVTTDEILKNFALKTFPNESEISGNKLLELAIHKNNGIAFDLPVWLPLVTVLTVLIVATLIWLAIRNLKTQPWISTSALIIVFGALGNLFDRLYYGFTVDYLITPATGSAFNLSDLIIITGLILLIVKKQRKI